MQNQRFLQVEKYSASGITTVRSMRARLVVCAAALAGFLLLAWAVKTGRTDAVDESVRQFAYSVRTPFWNAFFPVFTQAASAAWIISGIALLLIIPATRIRAGLPQMCTQLVTFGWYKFLKAWFARPRPDQSMWLVLEHGWSFPSGHSMNGLIFYGMLIYYVRRYVKNTAVKNTLTVLFAAVPLTVFWSRIYLGVHYLTDVLGGALMGLACVMAASVIIDRVRIRRMAAGSRPGKRRSSH